MCSNVDTTLIRRRQWRVDRCRRAGTSSGIGPSVFSGSPQFLVIIMFIFLIHLSRLGAVSVRRSPSDFTETIPRRRCARERRHASTITRHEGRRGRSTLSNSICVIPFARSTALRVLLLQLACELPCRCGDENETAVDGERVEQDLDVEGSRSRVSVVARTRADFCGPTSPRAVTCPKGTPR